MSVNLCMDTIIGLTRQEDDCVASYDPIYSQSDSGLFIDELQGMALKILDSLNASPDIWYKMLNARENAINTFKTDIFGELLKYNEYIRANFTGDIGYRRFTKILAHTALDWMGLRMYSEVNGGTFTLRGVTLNLNSAETVDLLIYDDFELITTIPGLTSLANKPKYNVITPVELTLNGNYYFVYQPVGDPFNNKITCGCGGYHWCFRPERPCYKPSRDKWTDWAMIGGVHGNDVNDRDDWSVSQYTQGLRLHGDFKCDATAIICSDASDFENNEVDRAIAFAVLYKSAEFLTYDIMNSGEVSRWTLLGKDDVLNDNMKYYSERYVAMINFIAENIEPQRNECLKCKSRMSKTTHRI